MESWGGDLREVMSGDRARGKREGLRDWGGREGVWQRRANRLGKGEGGRRARVARNRQR